MDINTIHLSLLPPWANNIVSLGIPCISPELTKAGYNVIKKDYNNRIFNEVIEVNQDKFYDYSVIGDRDKYNEIAYPLLEPYLRKWADEIIESKAELVGFTTYDLNLHAVLGISEMIKQINSDIIIVLGGPEVIKNREFLEHDCIDYAICSDGEFAFTALVNALKNEDRDLRELEGLIYRDRQTGEVVDNGECRVKDMDLLPFPDFSGYSFADYAWGDIVPIEGSRGCINDCTFCNVDVEKKKYRHKSGARLFREFSHRISSGKTHFYFTDSLINGHMKELEKFCEQVIEHDLNNYGQLIWDAHACIRKEMTPEFLAKMKKAGCNLLHIGLESASDNVLKDMKKRITADLAAEVLDNINKAGILALIFVIVGFPTETEQDFQNTLDFMTQNHDSIHEICLGRKGCIVGFGSDLYINPDRYGIYWKSGDNKIYNNWYARNNTPEIREARAGQFITHCEDLGIKVYSWI
ncbi:MAG: radical SAM protein [Spirochaetales bacterium]|nr:radical SAM protein [Spirochaetales bacterium]